MGATSEFSINCEMTNGKGVILILRKWYSFERSHSILKIVLEDDFYEDEYIQILKSFCYSNVFYYMLKRSSKV